MGFNEGAGNNTANANKLNTGPSLHQPGANGGSAPSGSAGGVSGNNNGPTGSAAASQQQTTSNLLSNIERANFKDSIMIHVIDDSKNEKRDFNFSRALLVKYMKYFDKCLKKISDQDEIDISIHCDAVIFEWLLNYILAMEEFEKKQQGNKVLNGIGGGGSGLQITLQKCGDNGIDPKKSAIQQYNGPKLDIKNAVTILISADFLKIDRLVKECLEFFVENIEEISRVQVDMGCINSQIIRDMARKVSLDRLNQLKERKDKLVSRLFMKKLELLLEKESNYLYKCAHCNKLFTMSQRKVMHCTKAKSYIDSNGQIRAKHVVDKSWDLKKFVTFVRETYRISWREIYWKVWSYLYVFKCDRCSVFYHITEMGNCNVHQQSARVKASLTGPLGSSYQYSCCKKEVSATSILNVATEEQNGCQDLVHEVSETYQLDASKEQKITERIIAHQLIILEHTGKQCIDSIKIREFNPSMDEKESTIKMAEGTAQPSSIVRPSSLNYKISLSEAVMAFIKKDMPVQENEFIDVVAEEPKTSGSNNNAKNNNPHVNPPGEAYDEFDDLMFDMTTPNTKQGANTKSSKNNPQTPMNTNMINGGTMYVSENGQAKDAWFREEELMRKKLEKGAINQLKSRIAQQNRQAGNKNVAPEPVQNDNNDSDMEPAEKDDIHVGSNAVNPTQVQLNPQQVEEAKQMTYGKLRQFRRDRLYASDRDRIQNLIDQLKKTRVSDDQQNQSNFNQHSSPNKTNASKNWDHHGHSTKGTSAAKVSPNKNQQVMTQISNIYNKRSRSILNQFNQTNIGGGGAHAAAGHSNANHGPHGNYGNSAGNAMNNHMSPNQNITQGRGSVGNSNNLGVNSANVNSNNNDDHNKGSPRMGRMRGISPQSREKNYMTGNNTNAGANNFAQSAQNTSGGVSGNMMAGAAHSQQHPTSYGNQSGQNNMTSNSLQVPSGSGPGQQVGVQNMSNLSNIMSTNNSTSFQGGANSAATGMMAGQGGAGLQTDMSHLLMQHGALPNSQHAHHGNQQVDRINHSSPNKGPGGSSIGFAAGSVNNGGMTMVGSQAGSIQQGSVGGISGLGGISGMSSSGARPSMNQTSHGKSFPYSMHRKTNSNKLPHIGSSNSKENTSSSIQQPSSTSNIYNAANNTQQSVVTAASGAGQSVGGVNGTSVVGTGAGSREN